MSALPVAHVLMDLESNSGRARKSRALPELQGATAKRADAESRLEEARSLGLAEGKAAERAEWEATLAQHAVAFEHRLATERQRWTGEQSERLGALLVSAINDFETRMADKLARVLKPVLAVEVRRRAVSELLALLDGLLSKGELATLTVSGPEDLLEALRGRLDGKIANVNLIANAGCDLRITADETTFETRIGDWVRAIEGEGR